MVNNKIKKHNLQQINEKHYTYITGGQCMCVCSSIHSTNNERLFDYFVALENAPSEILTIATNFDRSVETNFRFVKTPHKIGLSNDARACGRKCSAEGMLFDSCN